MANIKSYPRKLNLDDSLETLQPEDARNLLNVRGYSSSGSEALSLENIKSTVEATFTEASGDNLVVGSISHEEKNDIYIFIWNSNANHRIIKYNSITTNIQIILTTNLLGFTKTCHIQGFAITSQSPSDTLLYWTDGVTQPKKINVTRALNYTKGDFVNGYPNPLTIEYIRWIKYPPILAATFTHEKEPSVVYNNLAEEVFEFRYRYVFKDGERSAYSVTSNISFSEYQLRNGVFQSSSTDFIYNYLNITVQNAWNDVDRIEVIAKKGTSTEWVLVETLVNDPNNPTQSFRFFNDKTYRAVDVADSNKLYDAVPIKATAVEYIYNRAILGNAVDGYDNLDQNELNTKTTFGVRYESRQEIESTPINAVVDTNADTITFVMNGLTVAGGDTFFIDFTALGFVLQGYFYFEYSANDGDTIADVVNNLAAQADGAVGGGGLTITSAVNTANDLVITILNLNLLTRNDSIKFADYSATPSYKAGAKHPVGVVYYDFANRNGSVQRSEENSPYVEWFSERGDFQRRGRSKIDVRLGYTPPVWATHYSFVYGGNSSVKSKIQYPVTKAYVNVNNVSGDGDTNLYIPLNTFKGGSDDDAHGDAYRPSTGAIPDYDFSQGDRLRIISFVPQGSTGGEGDREYATEYLDFKIVDFKYLEKDSSTNPIWGSGKNAYGWTLIVEDPNRGVTDAWSWEYIKANSVEDTNWYVKNSGDGHGSSAYIEIYNINDRNVEDVYYETGFQYEIDAAGTANRNHKAQRDQGDNYAILEADVLNVDSATNSVIYDGTNGFLFFIGDVINFQNGTASPAGDFTIVDITRENEGSNFYQVFFDGNIGVNTAAELGDSVIKDTERYAAVTLDEGDVWLKPRKLITGTLDNNAPSQRTIFYDVAEDAYANDFFESANWINKGRVQVYSEYAKQEDRKASVWLSEAYFPDTNINGLSAFNLANEDSPLKNYDRSLGGIQVLKERGDQLIIYQENKVSFVRVGKNTLTTGDGGDLITLTSSVLSEQVPYAGDYGIGMNPESFADKDGNHYFLDIKRGKVMRLASDGLTPISDYKISKLLDALSFQYMTIVNSAGFKAYGGFDREHDEYNLTFSQVESVRFELEGVPNDFGTANGFLDRGATDVVVEAPLVASSVPNRQVVIEGDDTFVDIVDFEQLSTDNIVYLNTETVERNDLEIPVGVVMQGVDLEAMYKTNSSELVIPRDNNGLTVGGNPDVTVTPLTIAFHEDSNTWAGFRSYIPNGYANINYTMLSFKDGTVWRHDRGVTYNEFYGVAYDSEIGVVLPSDPSINKVFNSVSTESNKPFNAVKVETNLNESSFSNSRFTEKEGIWYSDLPRATSTLSNTNSNIIGVGEIASQNANNLTLSTKINELGLTIGDSITNSNGTVDMGTVVSIVDDFTIELTINPVGAVGDFVYATKDAKVNGDAIRGVWLKVDMSITTDEFMELFAINTNVDASNLVLPQK